MKALLFDGSNVYLDNDYPLPRRQKGEVLVRIERAGICDTDLQIVAGYMAYRGVLGHECVGRVEQADDPSLIDARVVAEINTGCGHCSWCLRAEPEHCPERTVLGIQGRDGVMAEYAVLNQSTLKLVPENVSSEQAVFTEPLAAALEITQRIHIRPTDRVLIMGDGKLGGLITQVLGLVGCNLTVLGRHRHKLEALKALCSSITISQSASALLNSRFDVVIEATGRAEGLDQAISFTRPRGSLVLKSTVARRPLIDLNRIVIDEINLIGSRCGPFDPALRLLESGLIQTSVLVEAIVPLTHGVEAFQKAQQQGSRKIILDPCI
ncbi:alcohol dehydrogenase catalytic domain-containing protein [bacterium]|nr:alcohol dehydrogenase catalytic domain-containing protein [bacterium]